MEQFKWISIDDDMAGPVPNAPRGGSAMAGDGKDAKRRALKAAMLAHSGDEVEPLRSAIEAAEVAGLDPDDIQQAKEILRKLENQLRPLTFRDILRPDAERLQEASSRAEVDAILARCMGLSPAQGFQADILADFHYNNFAFCQRSGFGVEKMSTFLSIMKDVHTKAVVEERLPATAARGLLEGLVARHARKLPPFSVGVFSQEDADALLEYSDKTFFRHYKMYGYAYAQRKELSVQTRSPWLVPRTTAPMPFGTQHEVDPREVPELRDLLVDPGA